MDNYETPALLMMAELINVDTESHRFGYLLVVNGSIIICIITQAALHKWMGWDVCYCLLPTPEQR